MILAGVLLLIASQDTGRKADTEKSSTDPMIAAINAAAPDDVTMREIDAQRSARLAKLRKAKEAGPATTGRALANRTREQEADAAFLALAELDELLRKDGKLAADPFAADGRTGPAAKLSPNWVAQHQSFCSLALRMDDPLKALVIEAQGLMMDADERFSLAITCRIYWTAFDRAVYQVPE